MRTNLSDNFGELNKSVQNYIKIRTELIKLTVLEKMTKISVYLISLISGIIFATLFIFLFAAAFVVWYGTQYQDFLTGLLIVIGVLFILLVLFLIFKKSIITSTIIENLSSILFEDDEMK